MPEQEPSGPTFSDNLETATTALVQSAGELASLVPDPQALLAGALLKGSAAMAGQTVRQLWDWMGHRKGARQAGTIAYALVVGDKEGIGEEVRQQQDLIHEAAVVAGDAESEAKRQMIADIILNAGARHAESGAADDALTALRLVGGLSTEAVRVFATVAAATVRDGLDEGVPFASLCEHMPRVLVHMGLHELTRAPFHFVENPQDRYKLNTTGRWLARWVIHNPPRRQPRESASSS